LFWGKLSLQHFGVHAQKFRSRATAQHLIGLGDFEWHLIGDAVIHVYNGALQNHKDIVFLKFNHVDLS
jgi:hypothetical protein